MNPGDVLREFCEALRDRAAMALRNADAYRSSGYRGEALLLEERARAFEAAAQLAESEAARHDASSGRFPTIESAFEVITTPLGQVTTVPR